MKTNGIWLHQNISHANIVNSKYIMFEYFRRDG